MALLKELDTMAAHSRCGAGGVVGVHMCACFFFSSFSGGDAHNEHYSWAPWFEWIQKSWQRHALFGSSVCVPFPPMNKAFSWTGGVLYCSACGRLNSKKTIWRMCNVDAMCSSQKVFLTDPGKGGVAPWMSVGHSLSPSLLWWSGCVIYPTIQPIGTDTIIPLSRRARARVLVGGVFLSLHAPHLSSLCSHRSGSKVTEGPGAL